MRKVIFGAIALFLMASCSGNGSPAKEEEQEVVKDSTIEITNQEPAEVPSAAAPTDAVNDHKENALQDKTALEQSARDFVNNMYAVVLRSAYYPVNYTYFTPEFVILYNQTIKVEGDRMSASDSDGGMDEMFFDDEFWSSYNDDPKSMGARATITKVTIDENKNGVATATVYVNIIPDGNESPIKIDLVMTDNGWKINDYRGFKKHMQRYLIS